MRVAVVYSRTTHGILAPLITIEAHISPGLPGFTIVGLPETAIKESRERVRSAIINSHYEFPAKKIIINLAPADLPKEGSKFDLPIALSILAASNQISKVLLQEYEFSGELALNGELRKISKSLSVAMAVMHAKRNLVLPCSNATDFLPKHIDIKLAHNLRQVCEFLDNKETLAKHVVAPIQITTNTKLDFKDVYGQEQAKRALSIACAGKHNVLMIGPPGTGKTMLAERITSVMATITYPELLEVAAIRAFKYPLHNFTDTARPFRAPHHTASTAAMVGGGMLPTPGEISLAHAGVLFLDELPEFNSKVIDCLREPLESKNITIARSKLALTFPANFILVAAMNPCPCGNYGSKEKECSCPISVVKKYLARVSGPILDRIDIKIYLSNISASQFFNKSNNINSTSSKYLREKVECTIKTQHLRTNKLNSEYSNDEINQYCPIESQSKELLAKAIDRFGLPPRKCNKIIKLARTIADMEGSLDIQNPHVAEAVGYSLWRGGEELNCIK